LCAVGNIGQVLGVRKPSKGGGDDGELHCQRIKIVWMASWTVAEGEKKR
jgi:hypothetical protein